MSIEHVAAVFKTDISPSSVKFVMVAIADNANDTNLAFPSVETICRKTSQDRKTVLSGLARLQALGLITDTQKRVGATKSVKVWRINLGEAVPNTDSFQKPVSSPVFPTKQSRFSAKQSQKRDTEPLLTIREPSDPVEQPELLATPKGRKKFIPPSIPEVRQHFIEKGLNGAAETEAEKFWNHHDARNWWLSKGVKMVNWKSAAATWITNFKEWARDKQPAPQQRDTRVLPPAPRN